MTLALEPQFVRTRFKKSGQVAVQNSTDTLCTASASALYDDGSTVALGNSSVLATSDVWESEITPFTLPTGATLVMLRVMAFSTASITAIEQSPEEDTLLYLVLQDA